MQASRELYIGELKKHSFVIPKKKIRCKKLVSREKNGIKIIALAQRQNLAQKNLGLIIQNNTFVLQSLKRGRKKWKRKGVEMICSGRTFGKASKTLELILWE